MLPKNISLLWGILLNLEKNLFPCFYLSKILNFQKCILPDTHTQCIYSHRCILYFMTLFSDYRTMYSHVCSWLHFEWVTVNAEQGLSCISIPMCNHQLLLSELSKILCLFFSSNKSCGKFPVNAYGDCFVTMVFLQDKREEPSVSSSPMKRNDE